MADDTTCRVDLEAALLELRRSNDSIAEAAAQIAADKWRDMEPVLRDIIEQNIDALRPLINRKPSAQDKPPASG